MGAPPASEPRGKRPLERPKRCRRTPRLTTPSMNWGFGWPSSRDSRNWIAARAFPLKRSKPKSPNGLASNYRSFGAVRSRGHRPLHSPRVAAHFSVCPASLPKAGGACDTTPGMVSARGLNTRLYCLRKLQLINGLSQFSSAVEQRFRKPKTTPIRSPRKTGVLGPKPCKIRGKPVPARRRGPPKDERLRGSTRPF